MTRNLLFQSDQSVNKHGVTELSSKIERDS